jgi:3-phenylpropionate/trans-cinnamate dioxygenase ferredoxin reductase subunit
LARVENRSDANDGNASPYMDVPPSEHMCTALGIRPQACLTSLMSQGWVVGAPGDDRFAVAFRKNGVLVGDVAVNAPKDLIRLKRAITTRDSFEAVAV